MRDFNTDRPVPKTKAFGTILAALIAVTALILVTITHQPKSAVSSPMPAEAAIVPQIAGAKSEAEILLRGKSFSVFRRQLAMGYGGIVTAVKAQEGEAVKEGQVLAEYNLDKVAMLEVQRILRGEDLERAKLESSNQQLNLEKWLNTHLPTKETQLERATRELKHLRELRSKDMASSDALKNKEDEVESIKKQIQEIKTSIKQTEAALKKSKEDVEYYQQTLKRNVELLESRTDRSYADASVPLSKAFLKAPIDGHLTWINNEVREHSKLNQNFLAMTVAPLKSMVVRCKVHELDLVKIQLGQRGAVVFDALPEKQYSCKVSKIPWLSRDPGLELPADYEIECALEDLDRMIKEGLTCNVKIAVTR